MIGFASALLGPNVRSPLISTFVTLESMTLGGPGHDQTGDQTLSVLHHRWQMPHGPVRPLRCGALRVPDHPGVGVRGVRPGPGGPPSSRARGAAAAADGGCRRPGPRPARRRAHLAAAGPKAAELGLRAPVPARRSLEPLRPGAAASSGRGDHDQRETPRHDVRRVRDGLCPVGGVKPRVVAQVAQERREPPRGCAPTPGGCEALSDAVRGPHGPSGWDGWARGRTP